ncbi:MAG TPA: hypothetical protein VFX29_01835 [Longimicrobiaceae bacterium]|nr:hypothetical protein [Longimicrobiaceae bacterium]
MSTARPNDQELVGRLVELAGSQEAAGELVGLSQRAISHYSRGRPIQMRVVRKAIERAVGQLEQGACPCCGGSGEWTPAGAEATA